MKIMRKKSFLFTLGLVLFVGSLLFSSLELGSVAAETFLNPNFEDTDTLIDPLCVGVSEIEFVGDSNANGGTAFFEITFDDDFDLTGLEPGDITLFDGVNDCSGGGGISVEAGNGNDGNGTDEVYFIGADATGGTIRVLVDEANTYGGTLATDYFSVLIDDDAVAAGAVATNSSAANAQITLRKGEGATDDTDGQASIVSAELFYIGGANQSTINGVVDPAITLTLENFYDYEGESLVSGIQACQLGILPLDEVRTCSYDITVSTNAQGGFYMTLTEDNPLTLQGGTLTATIPYVSDGSAVPGADGTVTAEGTSGNDGEYGVATTEQDNMVGEYVAELDDVDAIAGAPNQLDCECASGVGAGCDATSTDLPASALSSSQAHMVGRELDRNAGGDSSDTATVCVAAAAGSNTQAGTYTSTQTVEATATF